MKIAMVSEHASPLAALGGVDAGGQNVHVAELSAALSRRGHEVAVYTRRDDPDLPERIVTPDGYSVHHVPAGPAEPIPKDELLQYMGDSRGTSTGAGRPTGRTSCTPTSGCPASPPSSRHATSTCPPSRLSTPWAS